MNKKSFSRTLGGCLLAASVLASPVTVFAAGSPDTMTAQEIQKEYDRLMGLEAGDALDAFLNQLTPEQRAAILAMAAEEVKAEEGAAVSGECGEHLLWTLSEDGTLTVSGEGAMESYSETESAPWFAKRTSIKKVVIEKGVTTIGSYAFHRCNQLTEITLPQTLEALDESAFQSCIALRRVNLPSMVTALGIGVFEGCESLESVSFPAHLQELPENTFRGCEKLSGITLPAQLTAIGDGAFEACVDLKSISIPTGVTALGENAFRDCRALTEMVVPAGVAEIARGTFSGCSAMQTVALPAKLTAIGDDAFRNCAALVRIQLPAALDSIGSGAFRGCAALEKVSGNEAVTAIGDSAFLDCKLLNTVTLNDGLLTIGKSAFENCEKLTAVTFPEELQSVGQNAFRSSGLTSLTFPGDCPKIGKDAFDGITADAARPCSAAGWEDADASAWGGTISWTLAHPKSEETELEAKAPSCTETGLTAGIQCAACGTILKPQEEIPMTEHSMVTQKDTEDGTEELVCSVCGISADALTVESPDSAETAEPEEEEVSEEISEPDAQILVGQAFAPAGSNAEITVALAHNPGLVSASLEIDFDEDALELIEVRDAQLLDGSEHPKTLEAPYTLNWVNDDAEENFMEDGTLVTLVFRIREDTADGSYPIHVSYAEEFGIYNVSLDNVPFAVEDGAVIVSDSVFGDLNRDGKVDEADKTLLLAYLADPEAENDLDLAAADVNLDGKVNNLDRAILTRHLAGWEGYQSLPVKK